MGETLDQLQAGLMETFAGVPWLLRLLVQLFTLLRGLAERKAEQAQEVAMPVVVEAAVEPTVEGKPRSLARSAMRKQRVSARVAFAQQICEKTENLAVPKWHSEVFHAPSVLATNEVKRSKNAFSPFWKRAPISLRFGNNTSYVAEQIQVGKGFCFFFSKKEALHFCFWINALIRGATSALNRRPLNNP